MSCKYCYLDRVTTKAPTTGSYYGICYDHNCNYVIDICLEDAQTEAPTSGSHYGQVYDFNSV